jgi:hypothetical protein
MTSQQLHCSRSVLKKHSLYVERIPAATKIQLRRWHVGRPPHTSDSAKKTVYSLLNRYRTGDYDFHDWTMTSNVSTSLDTAAYRSVVASKSSPSRKVANESQSFYPVTTTNATTVQLPTWHVGCRMSTSEKEDETEWKIVHRAELCGTEWRRRIPLRLHHDSRRVHVILHSQKCPRNSPRVTTQSQGTAVVQDSRIERSGQVFLLVFGSFWSGGKRYAHFGGLWSDGSKSEGKFLIRVSLFGHTN